MTRHLLADEIEKYAMGRLTPDKLLAADDHLGGCDVCLQQLDRFRNARCAVEIDLAERSAVEDHHLSFEHLEGYVDENLDGVEREIADVHLQTCTECKLEIDGLFEMRKMIESDIESTRLTPTVIESTKRNNIWNLLFGIYPQRLGLAALALLLILCLIGVFWITNRQKTEEIAVTKSPADANAPVNILPANIQPKNTAPDNGTSEIISPQNSPVPAKTEPIPPQHEKVLARVLADEDLHIPAEIKQLKQQPGKLMGGGTDEIPFALSSPIGKVISSSRPGFQWRELPGATGYSVQVFDENYDQVTASPVLSGTNWRIDKPLSPNRTYIWQVTAVKDGKEIKSPVRPAPEARFRVLDPAAAQEIEKMKRQSGESHLLLGILFARSGLFDDAEREFQLELSRDPKSRVVRKFLQDVRRLK